MGAEKRGKAVSVGEGRRTRPVAQLEEIIHCILPTAPVLCDNVEARKKRISTGRVDERSGAIRLRNYRVGLSLTCAVLVGR